MHRHNPPLSPILPSISSHHPAQGRHARHHSQLFLPLHPYHRQPVLSCSSGESHFGGVGHTDVRREERGGPHGGKRRSRRQRGRLRSVCDAGLPQSPGGPAFEDLGGVRFRRKEALNAHLLHRHILRRTKGGNGGEQAKGRLTLIINRRNPLRAVVILAGSEQRYS
jgi:hypothetical protein